MTALLPPFPKFFAVDSNGAPLAGGLLYTYAAGTTTPLATYTDSTGSVENTNPVVLDSNGQANVWLTTGTAYKFVLENSLGQVQWTVDNITGGIQGAAGAAGSVWRNGSGVPSNSIGVDGDYYLNDANGDVYQRSGGVYTIVANILGPAGSSVNRIVNGRFWQALTPWISNGTVPPVLGTGSSANSNGAVNFADQSISAPVTSDGSISQAFSIQALSGTQNLTFKTACWLQSAAALNANTGFVKVYLFDGQNNTETLIGTYNFTATSSTPTWVQQTIDVTSYLPVQGDYGLRFEIEAYTDNTGGAAGTKGTYTGVDDVQLITSSAGVAGPTGPQGPQGIPGSSSGVLKRVSFTAVGANSWTSPASVNFIDVTIVGGGGGGGGGHTALGGGGGGGGAGATIRRRITITPNTAYTITIGAKGLGSSAGFAGTDGTDSTFSTLITAKGGKGGARGNLAAGGNGGASGGPDTTFGGARIPIAAAAGTITGTVGNPSNSYPLTNVAGAIQSGGAGSAGGDATNPPAAGGFCESYSGGSVTADPNAGGGGGASPFGAGGAGGDGTSTPGSAPLAGAYGAGGGGGTSGTAGGNGMDGYCIIEYVG